MFACVCNPIVSMTFRSGGHVPAHGHGRSIELQVENSNVVSTYNAAVASLFYQKKLMLYPIIWNIKSGLSWLLSKCF